LQNDLNGKGKTGDDKIVISSSFDPPSAWLACECFSLAISHFWSTVCLFLGSDDILVFYACLLTPEITGQLTGVHCQGALEDASCRRFPDHKEPLLHLHFPPLLHPYHVQNPLGLPATMSRPGSTLQSSAATPALSASPPPSESFQSDIDGASLLDGGTTEYGFDSGRLGEGSGLNLVSWKLDVNAHSEDGVEKRGFNGVFI
jgi:hypothetical protein